MFYDGYPTKGTCAGSGGHEAAGYIFVLPYDVPETPKAQRNWRYCGKCQAMFYDGYPNKGECAKGGPHQAIGYNFVLSHDMPETPTAQHQWRFCGKCQALFYDGYPAKGVCAKGGNHQAAGYDFVLAHETDYPGKVGHLGQQGGPLQDVLRKMWNEVGRAVVAERVQQAIDGRKFADGVNGYNAHASVGDVTAKWDVMGAGRYGIELRAPGNNVEFHATTPTVFGSYGDPAFRVGFGLLIKFVMGVQNGTPPISVDVVDARATDASVHGSNAVGTLVETVADFFTGGAFSRDITSKINNDTSLKQKIGGAITSALDRVW
jgi:hypothetical protein